MMKLNQITNVGGDETAGYSVELDKEYSLKDFIGEVLTRKEWGTFTIYTDESWKACRYKRDELLDHIDEKLLNKKVKSATASGGWSLMNYKVTLVK